ncbi:MAG: DUF2330 domain-containing protein [Myxococcota bacterium]
MPTFVPASLLTMGLCVLTATFSGTPARACAPAPPLGGNVSVADEDALIVWEADSKTQHFIRRASFQADVDDFGFIVPTPGAPSLHEVDSRIFDRLGRHIEPEVVYEPSYVFGTCCTAPFMLMSGAAVESAPRIASAGVEVLLEDRVAGMDAVVLAANRPEELSAWLSEHGYATRPALTAWLAPYVEQGWKITAFKVAKGSAGPRVGMDAVRMTFSAERPFYPYREPPDEAGTPGRLLRVYLVSEERMEGRVEGVADSFADVPFSAPSDELEEALQDLGVELPPTLWLTAFEDRSTERPFADVFFRRSDQGEVRPDPIVIERGTTFIPLPVEPLVLGAVGFFFWRYRKRKHQ